MRLAGAAEALREVVGVPIEFDEQGRYEQLIASLRERLDEARFSDTWVAGRALTLEQAIAEALGSF